MGDATEPARAAGSAAGGSGQGVADDPQADDPWFAPGPKTAVSPGTPDADDAAGGPFEASPVEPGTVAPGTGAPSIVALTTGDGPGHETDWFLRTGRAGLHPDSETSWDDPAVDLPADQHELRVTAAGAPPWAGETTAVSASTPPPWETGPWPGPGGMRPAGVRAGDDQGAWPASRKASTAGAADGSAADRGADAGTAAVAGSDRWPARTVMTAGLIPLVIPGLVLGFLSLRQAGSQAIRKASVVAIGASLAWAVIIIVIVISLSGGSPASCGGYPAAVHQAYEKAVSDLSSNVPASAQEADFGQAASLANASAAATGQIGVRTALFRMASDMAQAKTDVVAGRPISATLRQQLAADGAPPAGSCAS